MNALYEDLKVALRRLRRSPLFVLVAVTTLALGIGLNATIFTFVDAVLLRPPAVADPDELVDVYTSWPEETHASSSLADVRDLERATGEVLDGLFGYSLSMATLQQDGRSELIVGELATGGFFDVLGVPAAHGRTLRPADDVPGAPRVMVASWDFFRDRLGGDPAKVGSTVRLNGESWEVVGVAPGSFGGLHPGGAVRYWIPARKADEIDPVGQIHGNPREAEIPLLERRGYRWLWIKGRLAEGATAAQAEARLRGVMSSIAAAHPLTHEETSVRVLPDAAVRFHPDVDGALRAAAMALLGLVGLVLLVACANIANMLLARAVGRRREVAVRLSLGAGRGGLLRFFFVETFLVAALGGVAALGLSRLAIRGLLAHMPPLPVSVDLQFALDGRILAFTAGLSLLAGLAAAVIPALQASRTDLVPALKEGMGATGSAAGRLRKALVVAQVAISLVLLVAAALVLRGLSAASATDVGFDPRRVAVIGTNLSMHGYDGEEAGRFYERLRSEVDALPGVESASIARRVPFSINLMYKTIQPDSRQWSDDSGFEVDVSSVDEHYLDAVGLEVLRGRGIEAGDVEGAPRVALVTEAAAERYWPDSGALGRRFRVGGLSGEEVEVVGVVADHAVRAVGEDPRPLVLFSWHQSRPTSSLLVARSAAPDARALVQDLRRVALGIDPEIAFMESDTLEGMAGVTLYPVRAGSVLLAVFAGLGVFLSGVGLYGVVAYAARRRQREMGIRVALGARPREVIREILGDGLGLVGVGAVVGLVVAPFVGRLLSGVLYGTSPWDPVAFAGAAGVLLAVALFANLVPARRAARRDPVVALREE